MRSDHRHELKTNELADWIANFPEWANKNRTSLVAAAAVILVALLVYFVSFYRTNVVSVGNQTRLTTLVTEVPQQMSRIASAAMQGQDESYVLVQTEQDLQDFAQKSSNNDMAALALIQRGAAARAELHYRLSEISHDELVKQMAKAQASYQQALDRKPSLPVSGGRGTVRAGPVRGRARQLRQGRGNLSRGRPEAGLCRDDRPGGGRLSSEESCRTTRRPWSSSRRRRNRQRRWPRRSRSSRALRAPHGDHDAAGNDSRAGPGRRRRQDERGSAPAPRRDTGPCECTGARRGTEQVRHERTEKQLVRAGHNKRNTGWHRQGPRP